MFTHGALRSSQELIQKCPCIPESDWNLKMLVFKERGKPEYPENNLSKQSREPTTNSTHIWRRVRESNPGHIGGWRALSALRHLCHQNLRTETTYRKMKALIREQRNVRLNIAAHAHWAGHRFYNLSLQFLIWGRLLILPFADVTATYIDDQEEFQLWKPAAFFHLSKNLIKKSF